MKLRRVTPLLMLVAAAACTEARDIDTLEMEADMYWVDPGTGEPYSGPVMGALDDEGSTWKGTLAEGRPDGLYESFYAGCERWETSYWSSGVRHGTYESLYPEGGVIRSGAYSNGERCGEWVQFSGPLSYSPC